jgi:hypothetical protein
MACPMAAGLAALVLSANPNLEPADVKQLFHETSEHNTDARFPISPNNGYGWGVVEAYGVVKRARDLNMTFLSAPSTVHEGDTIQFTANTTYTRTEFTSKGLDGMRILGDDELLFEISIPALWGPPYNISATSEGDMDFSSNPSLRFDNGRWILEAEYHYTQDVLEPTEAFPNVIFQAERTSQWTTRTLHLCLLRTLQMEKQFLVQSRLMVLPTTLIPEIMWIRCR